MPVNSVLAGRRNNPAEPGIRPLAVYQSGPLPRTAGTVHGLHRVADRQSPSTTGAGNEGADQGSGFNMLLPIHDLNAALVSCILTDSRRRLGSKLHQAQVSLRP
ncbi:MAG: hypothetical protein R3F11_12240 [Verrucomicrobiales bacterium]